MGFGFTAFPGLLLASWAGEPAVADDLAWLAGHWVDRSPARQVEEIWSPPAGGILLAIGRTIEGERLADFEYLRIAPGPDGRLILFASPRGRPATAFPLVEAAQSRVRFENPDHDFPQRIIYRRTGDRLEAVISDLAGAREIRFTYHLQ